jgi:sortase A
MRSFAISERLFWVVGIACIGYVFFFIMQARAYSSSVVLSYERLALAPQSLTNSVAGSIEIPALSLSAPIVSDIDAESLRKGVGHIRGTAVPGGLGTVGLAGHRDSFFRPLRSIQPGMDITLNGAAGNYHYVVDSTEIVSPDKVHVLDIGERPTLTLVTCFPFNYVGAAPRRFIVHAHLLSAAPDRKLTLR